MILDNPILYSARGSILLARRLLPPSYIAPKLRPAVRLTGDDWELVRHARPELFRGRFKLPQALPDYFKIEPGTAVVWGEAGASGVTLTLTIDALASGSARMGAVCDLGATWDPEQTVIIAIESGTAPTAGGTVDLYLPSTHSTSYYPGGTTGSDAAWPSDGNEDEWAVQLGAPILSLVATNDGTTLQTQGGRVWCPPARYVVAVADNNMSQAVRDEATATNNDSRIFLVPRRSLVQDAA